MSQRLNSNIYPSEYGLDITVDFSAFEFCVDVEILLSIQAQASEIRLHCKELSVDALQLCCGKELCDTTHRLEAEELVVLADDTFAPGEYTLTAKVSGKLSDDLSGFYRSRYTDKDGNEAYLATTQLEAPYARRLFPCFDEPGFKAAFRVSLDVPVEMTAISNMPIASEDVSGERKRVSFETTPKMSTYLLYVGIGLFDFIEKEQDGRQVKVYGVNGHSRQGAFALDLAADTLAFFEAYTGVEYPLPKLDLIAIPDFAAGAMENWGAITFREVLLYVDDENTSLAVKKRIAEVIAHELWHQWSGNLVTMKWWDDLWLNESFATYMAFKAVDHFYPEWQIWDDFVNGDTKGAFSMDMLSSTHPIAVTVESPNEIEEIFDSISYGKGGSVLRMIEQYMGHEPFRVGVSAYLRKFAYDNAVATDLWDTLEQESGQRVKDVLIQWITKPGFPLLTVTGELPGVTVSQSRFNVSQDSDDSVWPVPLTWVSEEDEGKYLLENEQAEVPVEGRVVKFNKDQTGFYRSRYNQGTYRKLGEAVRTDTLSVHDRWGLVNDLWACVFTGYERLQQLLTFMDAFEREDRYFVLSEISSVCSGVAWYLELPNRGQEIHARYKDIFQRVYDELGIASKASDSPEQRQLRPLALAFLVRSGVGSVQEHAVRLADAYLENEKLEPDLRSACLQSLPFTGERRYFDRMIAKYERVESVEEKLTLLRVMGQFDHEKILEEYLNYALGDQVRLQDLRTVFATITANPASKRCFFEWAKQSWSDLHELSESHFVYMGLLQALIVTARDKSTLRMVKAFLEANSEGFEQTRANAFEKAELGLAFQEREKFVFD